MPDKCIGVVGVRDRACEPGRSRDRASAVPRQPPFGTRFSAPFEDAKFLVRTLEKGAHLRRDPRGFPRCALFETGAHLRTTCAPSKQGRALALHPGPFSRKVAQALAAASIPLFEEVSHSSHPLILALRRLRRFVSRREGPAGKEKSRAWIVDPDTAPLMRDLQLVAVPYFVVR
jgi:hypothetical protein